MPARHTSLQDVSLLEAVSNPKALVDERGCRRDIRSNGWIVLSGSSLLETGPAEETGFLRSVRISGPQFHRALTPAVKSGPDVFADALVPPATGVEHSSSGAERSVLRISRHLIARSTAMRGADTARSALPPVPAQPRDPIAANGYRLPKRQGKSNPPIGQKPPSNKGFCDLAAIGAATAFTFDSSRYLNCPSNFIGHGDPNKPANGVGE
jgi:hypothetical protein